MAIKTNPLLKRKIHKVKRDSSLFTFYTFYYSPFLLVVWRPLNEIILPRKRRLAVLIAVVLGYAAAPPATAQQSNNFLAVPVDALGDAADIMLGNPPLPSIDAKREGGFKIEPYYYNGTLNSVTGTGNSIDVGGGTDATGGFHGAGGAVSYDTNIHGRWGLYALLMGNAMTGNFSTAENYGQVMPWANGNSEFAGAAITYRFFGENQGDFVLPVFVGPLVEHYGMSANIQDNGGSYGNGNYNGIYNISGNTTLMGFMAGVEAGIPIGRGWALNPFAILVGAGPRKFQQINVTAQVPDANSAAINNEQVDFASVFANAGMNIVYQPWGLSANLTSSLLGDIIGKAIQARDNPLAGFRTTLFTVSWSFGRHAKTDKD